MKKEYIVMQETMTKDNIQYWRKYREEYGNMRGTRNNAKTKQDIGLFEAGCKEYLN